VCNFRSTPCSLVKHDEEWGELCACEAGDGCGSSHTRTEQQFHPEVEHLLGQLTSLIPAMPLHLHVNGNPVPVCLALCVQFNN